MLAFAAGVALVAARIWIGPGAALGAARLLHRRPRRDRADRRPGPRRDHAAPAALPRRGALRRGRRAGDLDPPRATCSAPSSGVLIGTVGFFAEYAWSHVWMPVPWPSSLIGEAILPAARDRGRRRRRRRLPRRLVRGRRRAAPSFAPPALVPGGRSRRWRSSPSSASTSATRRRAAGAPRSTLDDVERAAPSGPSTRPCASTRPTIGDDAYWLQAIAWQGGGLVVDQLERVSPGVYETTEPIPVHGTWKTLIRLQRDNYVAGLPIYLPERHGDPGAGGEGAGELRAAVHRRDRRSSSAS